MKNFLVSKKQALTVVASGLVSVLFVAGIAYSATTIDTNINTGGTLTVSGASTLTGNVTMSGTLGVTSASTLTGRVGIASSTPVVANELGVHGNVWISGNLSNVANVTATGTLTVTGLTTLGYASSSGISISTGANSLMVSGTATTTGSSGQFATQGFIGAAGTSTPAAELSATSAATTTLYLDTSGTKKGSCIELVRSTDGTVFRLYVGTTTLNNFNTTVLQVEAGSCK